MLAHLRGGLQRGSGLLQHQRVQLLIPLTQRVLVVRPSLIDAERELGTALDHTRHQLANRCGGSARDSALLATRHQLACRAARDDASPPRAPCRARA